MKGVSFLVSIATVMGLGIAEFLNNRPFPTYSLENMPDTQFSCRGKILGGYYADAETQCQMFHICVKVAGVGVQDFRFLCPNGTAFDQDHQICADWEDVDCDATTLYYSSDNFDLYRIGSGFETKAVKYGEDEEVFSLQKAETGDARLNREHQVQKVNQQRQDIQLRKKKAQNYNNERDIFKSSSSSHFFNNRNGGKETDEDYDDNVNANQNRDEIQKKKVVRKQQRRPQNNDEYEKKTQNNENYDRKQQQNEQFESKQQNEQYDRRQQINNEQYERRQQNNEQKDRGQLNNQSYNRRRPQTESKPQKPTPQNEQFEKRQPQQQPPKPKPQIKEQYDKNNQPVITTLRPNRPTGFSNNFAGSSYIPTTTSRPSTSTTLNIDQYTTALNNHRQRTGQRNDRQYNNAENFRQSTQSFAASTPAPFKQTQYNNPPVRQTTQYDNGQYRPSTTAQPQKQTENYPANFPKVAPQKQPTPFKKPTEPFLPTTIKVKPTPKFEAQTKNLQNYNTPQYEVSKVKPANKKPTTPFKQQPDFPSTFAPRTNAGYQSISQQTTSYKTTQLSASKATPFTQYTPTIPKLTTTPPVARSSRFDETQYDDDNSFNVKHDRREEESLRTAFSQNIANSRNELSKTTTKNPSTPQPYHESPRPFSVSPNTPKSVPIQQKPNKSSKKVKDTSYDYAYYDTNVGSEPEYEIDTEIKKSTVKN